MKNLLLLLALTLSFAVSADAKPPVKPKLAAPGARPRLAATPSSQRPKLAATAPSPGSISVALTFNAVGRPFQNPDLSWSQVVNVNYAPGINRARTLTCVAVAASDAGAASTLYLLDGAAVATPPNPFVNLCTFFLGTVNSDASTSDTKVGNVIAHAGMQSLLAGP